MAFTKAFRESTTLKLILVPFAIINFRYLLNTFNSEFINQAPISMEGFAAACGILIGVWIGREFKEVYKSK